MTCLPTRICIALTLLLAAPMGLARNGVDYLNPYADQVGRAIANEPAPAARPGASQGNGESATCRELRLRMERARSAPHTEPAPLYSDRARREGQGPGGALGRVPADPLADAEQRYRNECNR